MNDMIKRIAGYILNIFFSLTSVAGIFIAHENKYRAYSGINGSPDCDGPGIVFFFVIPSLIFFVVRLLIYLRQILKKYTPLTLLKLSITILLCLALSIKLFGAVKEDRLNSSAYVNTCGEYSEQVQREKKIEWAISEIHGLHKLAESAIFVSVPKLENGYYYATIFQRVKDTDGKSAHLLNLAMYRVHNKTDEIQKYDVIKETWEDTNKTIYSFDPEN